MLEYNDNEYDSDKDPPWTMKCGKNGVFQQSKYVDNIFLFFIFFLFTYIIY